MMEVFHSPLECVFLLKDKEVCEPSPPTPAAVTDIYREGFSELFPLEESAWRERPSVLPLHADPAGTNEVDTFRAMETELGRQRE